MAQTSMFWEGNSLLGTGVGDRGPYSGSLMAEFVKGLLFEKTGVLTGLAVIASSPNAKTVDVLAGKMVIKGRVLVVDSTVTLDIADNTSGNPRIDRVVAECDWANQIIRLKVVQGTPAPSPAPPSLAQSDGVLWQESLAQIAVANAFSTITDANITRERRWAREDFPGKLAAVGFATAPDGWLVCDGSAVSRTTYRDLFDAIGTQFGAGDGSTTFNLPDLRGRMPLGADNMGGTSANVVTASQADVIGGASGAETHILTLAQIPPHTHSIPLYNGGTSGTYRVSALQLANSAGSETTGSAGSGQAHNNMPPYLTVYYLIKT